MADELEGVNRDEASVPPVIVEPPPPNIDPARLLVGAPAHPARPRLWTALVMPLIAIVAAVVIQAVGGGILAVVLLAQGTPPDEIQTALESVLLSPPGFTAMALCSQLAFAFAALIAARLSPEPLRARLQLSWPRLPLWTYPVLLIGAWGSVLIGIGLVALATAFVGLPVDDSALKLWDAMTTPWAIGFILFIALVPGVVEEMLFRGYVQRRLLQRWSPWVAILVSSLLFALAHVMPVAMIFVFPIGLWFGFVAWRLGSIWPGMLMHAFINGVWNILQIGTRIWGIPEVWSTPVYIAVFGLIAVCFVASIVIVMRRPRQIDASGVSERGMAVSAM